MSEARVQRGTLIASGFIAGGSLMGVVGALLMLIRVDGNPLRHFIDLRMDERLNAAGVDAAGQIISIILFVALCAYLYSNSKRAKVSGS